MRKSQVGKKKEQEIYDDVLKYGYGTLNPDRVRVCKATTDLVYEWFNPYEMAETLECMLNGLYASPALQQAFEILIRQGRIGKEGMEVLWHR